MKTIPACGTPPAFLILIPSLFQLCLSFLLSQVLNLVMYQGTSQSLNHLIKAKRVLGLLALAAKPSDTSIALKHRRCRYPTAWRNSFQHHEIQNLTKVSTFYILRNPRNSPDKILKLMVTMTRSKVQSRAHHYDAHLWPLTKVLDSLPSINFLHLTVSEI